MVHLTRPVVSDGNLMAWQPECIHDRGQVVERLIATSITSLNRMVREWVPDDVLWQEFRSTLTEHVDHVDNVTFAEGFSRAMPIVGANQDDYRIRLFRSPRGHQLVAGIRFRSEPSFAFVEIYGRDIVLDMPGDAADLVASLSQHFSMFHPRYVRLHVAEQSEELIVLNLLRSTTDFLTVAAPLWQIRTMTSPSQTDRIQVIPVSTMDYYERYLREYDKFHERHPEMRDRVPVASVETLEQSRSIGALVDVYVDGTWAGMVAGRPQTAFGMTGFRIVEELLSEQFRGKGLGAATQRRFLEAVPVQDRDIVHGAIDPLNLASRRTAARVGRVEVMRTVMIPVAR